jgi:TP901 family phage tail tape measure protein
MFSLDLGNLLVHLRMDDAAIMKSMRGIQSKLNASMTLMENHFENFSRKMSSIGIRMSAAVTLPLVAGGKKSVEAFAEFEKGLAKISTVLQGQEMSLMQNFEKEIKRLSLTYGESTKDISAGLNELLQAAVAPSDALKILETGTKFAKSGFTSVQTAINALIGTLNSYDLKASDTKRVTDMMFATITRGKMEASEFADSIGRVTAVAAVSGVKLEELYAAFAGITRGGMNAEETATALRGVLIQFMKPAERAKGITEELAAVEKELGFELTTTTLRSEGLISVLRKLSRLSEDSLGKLIGGLVGDARALTGFSIALKGLAGVQEDYNTIMNSSGYAQTAFEKAIGTLRFAMAQAGVRVELLKISIGERLVPVVESLMNVLRKATNLWLSYDVATQQTIVHVGLVAAALGPLALGIAGIAWTFSTLAKTIRFLLTPVIALTTAFGGWLAIALAVGAVIYVVRAAWEKNLNGIKDRVDWIVDVITVVPKFLLKMFYEAGKFIYENFTGNLKRILSMLSFFVKVAYTTVSVFAEGVYNLFKNMFNALTPLLQNFISDFVGSFSGAYTWVMKMKEAIKSAWAAPNWATFKDELIGGAKEASTAWAEAFVESKETTDKGMEDIKKSMADGMNSVESAASSMISGIGEKIKEGTSIIEETVGDWVWMVKALPEAYKESTGNLIDAVKEQMASDIQSISSMLKTAVPGGLFGFLDDLEKRMRDPSGDVFGKMYEDLQKALKDMENALGITMLKEAWTKAMTPPKIDIPDFTYMTDESIESAVDKLYSGLNKRSDKYFDLQKKRIEQDTDLWIKNATKIAKVKNLEVSYVLELIAAYKEEQEVLMEIEKLKFSDKIVDGFKAAGMEIKREIKTWGERAEEFTTGMVGTLENGFMNMAQDMRNWGSALKAMLREIYFEAIRIAFMQKAAQSLAGAFSSIGTSLIGGLGNGALNPTGNAPSLNSAGGTGLPTYAAGGVAWHPQIATLAEREPELITPLSQLKSLGGGNVEVHMHNESGTALDLSSQTQYMLSDRRIIDVTVSALSRSSQLRHAVSQTRG